MVAIGDVGIGWNREVHRNCPAERLHSDRPKGNVLFRLPENGLRSGAVVSRTCDHVSNTRKTKIDAMRGVRIELEMNPSSKPAARRKRQRVKLEIGVAEALAAKRGAQGHHKKNHSN